MTIKWPARNARVIPTAANSIVVTLTQGSKTIASSGPIARPANGGTSSWTTPSISTGSFTIAARAFPNADGSGTAQASGAGSIAITSGATTQASVTMGSTVTSVTAVPATIAVRPGFTTNVMANASDSQGNMVLVADSAVTWNIGDQSVLKLATGGVQAQFKGLKLGTTKVTCQFTEVDPSLGQTSVSAPPAKCNVSFPGPATTGWMTWGGNQQKLTNSSAPVASGSVKWTIANRVLIVLAVTADGTLLTAGDNVEVGKTLTALNPDGSTKWTYTDGTSIGHPIVASDGTIYVNTTNKILVLNPDGTLLTSYDPGFTEGCEMSLASDGTIYWYPHGVHPAILHALGPDGTQKWSIASVQGNDYSPVIGTDGTIYIGGPVNPSAPPALLAINPNGTVKWTSTLKLWPDTAIGPIVCGPSGAVYATDGKNSLEAFDSNGNYLWTSSQILGTDGFCMDSKGNLFFQEGVDQKLSEIDPQTGVVTAVNVAGETAFIADRPSMTQGDVIYAWLRFNDPSKDGFYAIDTQGNVLWSAPYTTLSEGVDTTFHAIGPDGSVYFGGYMGAVIAVSGTASASTNK